MKPFNESNPQEAKFKKMGDEGFHGDVIVTMDHLPDGFEQLPRVKDDCLAYGEATGHCHMLISGVFDLREDPETKRKLLRVVEPTTLKHQEHEPRVIPPGTYRIGIQREYNPFEKLTRQVAD